MDKKIKLDVLNVTMESAVMQTIVDFKELPNGHISFEAILQTVNSINRNSNLYPPDVLNAALHAPRILDEIKRRAWFGEGSHPWDRKNVFRAIDVYPPLITHRICTLPQIVGDFVKAEIHTVEPCGKQVDSWVKDEGSQLGFSMRGITPYTYEKDTPVVHKVVKAPMNIITYDMVFWPSHPEALMFDKNSGMNMTVAQECALPINELTDYITEESAIYKIFSEELGIQLDKTQPVQRTGRDTVSVQLQDGRLANMTLEDNLLADLAGYLL